MVGGRDALVDKNRRASIVAVHRNSEAPRARHHLRVRVSPRKAGGVFADVSPSHPPPRKSRLAMGAMMSLQPHAMLWMAYKGTTKDVGLSQLISSTCYISFVF